MERRRVETRLGEYERILSSIKRSIFLFTKSDSTGIWLSKQEVATSV